MVIDFGDISSSVGELIKHNLDHRTFLQIGDPLIEAESLDTEDIVITEGPPTAENIGMLILQQSEPLLPERHLSVKLWETEDSFAECTNRGYN